VYAFVQTSISASQMFAVVVWLVGLSAIVLLWQRESAGFFAAARRAGQP
jgi:hypothetical protein